MGSGLKFAAVTVASTATVAILLAIYYWVTNREAAGDRRKYSGNSKCGRRIAGSDVCNCRQRFNKAKKKRVKLLVVGDEGAGKTTIIEVLLSRNPIQTEPTTGEFVSHYLHTEDTTLVICEVGGDFQPESPLLKMADDSDAAIFVMDASNICAERMRKFISFFNDKPKLVIANKQDICGALNPTIIEHILQRIPVLGASLGFKNANKKSLLSLEVISKSLFPSDSFPNHVIKMF